MGAMRPSATQPATATPKPSPLRAHSPRPVWILMAVSALLAGLQFIRPSLAPLPRQQQHQQQQPGHALTSSQTDALHAALDRCARLSKPAQRHTAPWPSRVNPRWHPSAGQNETLVLRNGTLFDGEAFLPVPVDVVLDKGVVVSVSPTSAADTAVPLAARTIQLDGKYVTPGLVDMHGHQLIMSWPGLTTTDDANEVNLPTGPITPFLRALDGLKPQDQAVPIIASGGVTSSMILPGSANIMGGEGILVKNMLRSGSHSEDVVDDLLLERGVPADDRHRYMKMAWGENPKGQYSHTRMGNVWILRQHLSRAQQLRQKQDTWCQAASAALAQKDGVSLAELVSAMESHGMSGPEALELESTIEVLRGKIAANAHCYETEDFASLLRISREFGFKIQAFHHALDAWQVPNFLKEIQNENITIATFANFGVYKKEAYGANLWAGKILADNDVPVAYKSDHGLQFLSAKYLVTQAAIAHSFHLDEDLALQAVTSVPAKSLGVSFRIGYVRPGYDADVVVWDSHPLSVGATPLQVYVDGRETLDVAAVNKSLSHVRYSTRDLAAKPQMRPILPGDMKSRVCSAALGADGLVITGITTSYLRTPDDKNDGQNLTLVLRHGRLVCLGPQNTCPAPSGSATLHLQNGHVSPGLVAVSSSLGLTDIALDFTTGDGMVGPNYDATSPENLVHAQYGLRFESRSLQRARIAGITRAVTLPLTILGYGPFWGGISVGWKTSANMSVLNGGIFKEDLALHFTVGQAAKVTASLSTISQMVGKLRTILTTNTEKDNIYGRAANGSIPIVVQADNKYDILQLVRLKRHFNSINLVIYGGAEASFVATELAESHIPVILTSFRGAPDSWEKADTLPGPPLTESPVTILHKAGVLIGLAISGIGDSFIHDLPLEAGWAGKFAGLSGQDAIDLVSTNVRKILGLDNEEEASAGDFVVYEGDPLQFGASVAVAVDGDTGKVLECWPEAM